MQIMMRLAAMLLLCFLLPATILPPGASFCICKSCDCCVRTAPAAPPCCAGNRRGTKPPCRRIEIKQIPTAPADSAAGPDLAPPDATVLRPAGPSAAFASRPAAPRTIRPGAPPGVRRPLLI